MSWIYSAFTLFIFLLSIMNCYRLYDFVIGYITLSSPIRRYLIYMSLHTDSADGSVSNLFSNVLDADGKNED